MWPFVLHHARADLPSDVYSVRGQITSWLMRNQQRWSGSVNRDEATFRRSRELLEGSELMSLEVGVRYTPISSVRRSRETSAGSDEHTRVDLSISLPVHQLGIAILVAFGFTWGAWRWSTGVRRGEFPFEWMAIVTFGIALSALTIMAIVSTTSARTTGRELLKEWSAEITARSESGDPRMSGGRSTSDRMGRPRE